MRTWDEAKKLTIDDAALRLGLRLPRQRYFSCPLPDHRDRTPSFSINRAKNVFLCFGCNRSGSVIDFVAAMLRCEPAKAVEWILQNKGASNFKRIAKPREILPEKETAIANDDIRAFFKLFLKLSPLRSEAIDYLKYRSISEKTAKHFRLGFLKESKQVLEKLSSSEMEQGRRAGMIVGSGRNRRTKFACRSLIVPYYLSNELIYLQARCIDTNTKHRWMGPIGIKKPIFNLDSIPKSDKVYVCEGAMDVLSAYELNLTAIGFAGASVKFPQSVLSSLKGKSVYIIPDKDEAGEKMAASTLRSLRSCGIQAVVQQLPQGKDLNDYLKLQRSKL